MMKFDLRLSDATEFSGNSVSFQPTLQENLGIVSASVPMAPLSRARNLNFIWALFAMLWACMTLLVGYAAVCLSLLGGTF